MNHKILFVAILMLCACAGIKAANYTPFDDVTTADGIYQQGKAVTPGTNQNAAAFNDTYVPFGTENNNGGTVNAGGNSLDDLGYPTGVSDPINGGWYVVISLACLLAAIRIRKVMIEE